MKKITKTMLKNWIGGDNLGSDDLVGLLLEVINLEYPVELFREEVLEYNDDEPEDEDEEEEEV